MRTDWTLTWYPLPLTCSLHPRLGQHGGVGVGWGGVGCNNVPCASLPLLAHCIHVLVSMGGWGWGGGAITYLRSAHGLDVHLVSTSTCLLTASMSWSAWGGGGGVGWGAITYLRSAHGLDVHLVSTSTYLLTASMSWSAWKGGGGVGRGGVQ